MKKAFTLIELLVVIAIIALLMAIVMPGLHKAKEYARKIICQSNERQIAIAIGTYESEYNYNFRNHKSAAGMAPDSDAIKKTWFWNNGTGDYAHEKQPFAVDYLMKNNLLPDRKVFFCPGVKNLAHDKNYSVFEISAGNYMPRDTEDIYNLIADGTLPSNDRPLFWSTHVWLWKKEIRQQVTSVNNSTGGAMMCDMTNGIWDFAKGTNATLDSFFNNVGITRAFQHNNVLMADLSVNNPSDKDEEIVEWLWASNLWAGVGY